MIHKNLTPFFWGPKVTSRTPPKPEMAVCVRGVFRLVPGEPVVAIEDPMEQGFMSGDTFAEDDIDQTGPLHHDNDFADFKLNAEATLRGSCHPPNGPANECVVRFGVGEWSKSLRVVGPRTSSPRMLLGSRTSEAQPFQEMPLTWENAYGGEGYALNPAGRGFSDEELPTIEEVDKPIKKAKVKGITPASFLPISPHWPQRSGKRGKNYGATWKRTRAPFFSDDFDPTCFHSAPADQQLPGFLRGDEQLTFENLHPRQSNWQTNLPGMRIRAFIKTADGKIHEPEMRLDTLFADIEGEKLCLTWRGLTPITELDMTDVAVVLIASEPLADAPAPAATYIEQLAEFEADPVGVKAGFAPGFLAVAEAVEAAEQAELNGTPMPDLAAVAEDLPPECPFPPWFLAAAAGEEDPLGVLDEFPDGLLDDEPKLGPPEAGALGDPAKQDELIADVAGLEADPGKVVGVMRAIAALLPADKQQAFNQGLDAFDEALKASENPAGENIITVIANQAEPVGTPPTMADGYSSMLDQIGTGVDDAAGIAKGSEQIANVQNTKANLAKAPASLDAAVADAMKPLDDIELPPMPELPDVEADLADKSQKLDEDEQRMRAKFGDHPMLGMFDMGRNLIANAPKPGDIAPDLSAIPAAMNKAQESLAAQGISAAAMAPLARLTAKVNDLVEQVPKPEPLPEGEFVGQDLRKRDFRDRDLQGAVFCKSDLTGSCFAGANLTGADFTRSDLTKVDFTGANLTDARFKGAVLTKAKMPGATAIGCDFSDCELAEVDATDAELSRARFMQARAGKMVLTRAKLTRAYARFADFSKSDLREADLSEADLSFATLELVKADKANFRDAILDIVRLTKSRLQGACLSGARCNMGTFTGSNLTGANLQNCAFEKADLTGTVLDDADFTGGRIQHATLRDVTGRSPCFREANLQGSSATGATKLHSADFRGATGDRSVWMGADLTGSTFAHATFESAYFQDATGEDVDFTAAVLKHANFRKVSFRRVGFAYADLASAIFQDATVDDGDFHKANCYDAKFLGAKAVRCRFDEAFLAAVQLDDGDTPGQEARS